MCQEEMRVIPAIDIMDGDVVRLLKGNPDHKVTYSNNPIETAKKWEVAGADMLHVVDLDAALSTDKNNIEIISNLIKAVNIPVEVAGGIRSINAIHEMFSKKASRVVLGTMAYKEPESIRQITKKIGEKIVIAIDQNEGNVMINGWREIAGPRIDEIIKLFLSMGIREFLLTSVDRDGTLTGPDILTLSYASSSFPSARIIASGGISSIEDVIRVRSIGCSSVILGKSLYDGKVSIENVKAIA
jgi:phosphoribosylformimino-5-aminoimidazole carboxamide ribotide isomerase